MKSDFAMQFIISPVGPMTWESLNGYANEIMETLILYGLDPEDFHVTDDPSMKKRLRLDIGLSSNLRIDDHEILTFLREKFKNLHFFDTMT